MTDQADDHVLPLTEWKCHGYEELLQPFRGGEPVVTDLTGREDCAILRELNAMVLRLVAGFGVSLGFSPDVAPGRGQVVFARK